MRIHVCGTNCGMNKQCKYCHQCFLLCPNFERRTCECLFTPPFVCNGCPDERICHLPKKIYIAKVAQADRESKLHDSRKGVHVSAEKLAVLKPIVANGLAKKQSPRHIITANKPLFDFSVRTLYTAKLETVNVLYLLRSTFTPANPRLLFKRHSNP